MTSRLVLVAGTGRSGTSTLTGVLSRLGLHVPQPEVTADASNPRGFGEPRWVVDLHDELLDRTKVQVSDARPTAWARASAVADDEALRSRLVTWLGAELDRSAPGTVLVKDPRLLWFVPLWAEAGRRTGADPAYITVLRPPAEVIGSKRREYNRGLGDAQGAAAWLNLVLGTERATRGANRAYVDYGALLVDWRTEVDRLAARLSLPLDTGPTARATVDGFVDPGLRRVRAGSDELDLPQRLAGLVDRTWAAFGDLAAGRTTAEPLLDELRGEYDQYYRESESIARSSVIAARAEASTAPRRRRSARRLLRSVRRSSST